MKWWPSEIKSGDMLRVKLGSIYHYGVAVSETEVVQFGMPPVPRYRTDGDIVVIKSSIDDFACECIVEVLQLDKKEAKTRIPPAKTVAIALSRLGEGGYNLLHNNCEHFANECVFGVRRSEQEEAARKRWQSRTITDVYFARIPETMPDFVIASMARRDYIASCTSKALKIVRTYDWFVLSYAAKRSLGIEIDALDFTVKHGKWLAKGFEFSLSHTDGAVAVAVSNSPCGVDIENENRFDAYADLDGLIDRAFDRRERETIGRDTDGLTVAWTAKEAIFKSRGDKAFVPQKICSLDADIKTVRHGGYVITVCAQKAQTAQFFDFDGDRASLIF